MSLDDAVICITSLLKSAGTKKFIGGLDVSANEDDRGKFKSHFQPHAWGFTSRSTKASIAASLRRALPLTDAVKRPLVFLPFDGRESGYRYAYRSSFDRRVTYECVSPTLTGRKRRTRKRELRAAQEVTLAIMLHKLGLSRRLILIGWRVDRTREIPKLVKIIPSRTTD